MHVKIIKYVNKYNLYYKIKLSRYKLYNKIRTALTLS